MQRTSSSLSRGASPAMIRRPSVGQACSPARVGVTSSASPVPLTRTVSQGSSLSGTAASPSLSRTSSHTSMSSLSSLSGSVGGYITRTTSLDNLTASVLSADEQALYAQLTTLAERRQHKTNIDVIVFTDCGKDKDDLMALMGLSVLHSLGLVNVLAVVVHMYPVNKRAALVRGLLDSLGLTKTRVLIGSNEYMPEPIMHEYYYEFEFDALPPASRQTEYHPMMQVLPGLLQKRWKLGRKIRLLSIGTVRDLLILISTETGKRLLQTTVDQIHIQGGIKWVLDGNGQEHLEPDPDANNNGNDFEAAKLFTPWLGKSGIPFVVYTKIATFNAPPPKDTFEHLPHDGNPLTKYLRHLHKEQGWTYYRCTRRPEWQLRKLWDEVFYMRFLTTWPRKTDKPTAMTDFIDPPTDRIPVFRQAADGRKEMQLRAPPQFLGVLGPYLKLVAYDLIAAIGTAGPEVAKLLGVGTRDPSRSPACAPHERSFVIGKSFAEPGTDARVHPIAISALLKMAVLNSQRHLSKKQSHAGSRHRRYRTRE